MSDLVAAVWNEIAESTGVPLPGLGFIYATFDFNRRRVTLESGGVEYPTRHCNAAEFCDSFVRLAKDTFEDEYIAALSSWRLNTSEKLGKTVFALAERNLIGRQENDLQSDFDSHFDFSNLGVQLNPARVYDFPTSSLRQLVYVAMPPAKRYQFALFAWLAFLSVWFGTYVIGDMIADRMRWNEVPFTFHVAGFAMGTIAASNCYRFSLRTVFFAMTAVAIVFGLIKCLLR